MTDLSTRMIKEDEVSIIVPTYHRVEDLKVLFNSILKLTKKPKEIIIVDDTPNSSIKKLCSIFRDSFLENKITLIYKRNKGKRSSARARNYGISIASGNYILFLDSDTYLGKNYIKEILDTFSKHPNALGVHGQVVGPGSRRRKGLKRYLSHFFNRIFLLGYAADNSCRLFEYPRILDSTINCEWLSGCNMALKSEVLEKYKFDDKMYKYSFSEDVLLSHKIFQDHPNSLYVTPKAKLLHYASDEGRMKKSDAYYKMVDSQRKYVLYSLLGQKGLLIYYRQKIGLFFLRNFLSNYF